MEEGPLTTPSVTASPWQAKLKRGAILAGVALAALGAAYGAGRLQTARAIDSAEAKAAEVSRAEKAALERVTAEQNTVKKLEARRRLHLALIALDQRNFGIAQEHLTEGARLLEGHTTGDLEEIRASLASLKLVATEDLETQRSKILQLVRRFDDALPPRKAD